MSRYFIWSVIVHHDVLLSCRFDSNIFYCSSTMIDARIKKAEFSVPRSDDILCMGIGHRDRTKPDHLVFEEPLARSCLASLQRSCGCKACHVEGKGPVSSARDWNGSSGSSPSRTRQPGRETVRYRNRTNWSGSQPSRFSSAIRRKMEVWNP